MDARRLGAGPHLPQAFLIYAAPGYLADADYDNLADDWVETAFAELAKRVHGKQAPLSRVTVRPPHTPHPVALPSPLPGSVFRLADYLEQHGRETRRLMCPPASFWQSAHASLTDPDDVNKLADAAYARYRLQWAHHLKRRAVDAGHPDACQILANWLEEVGNRKAAESLLWQVADAGDSRAFIYLAFQRENDGDLEGAASLAKQAADVGNPNLLGLLATWREEDGDRKRAKALMRKIADAGNQQALTVLAGWRAGGLAGGRRRSGGG
ncbi:hypothetical protein [Streptomyces sp. NPDC046862]|uniref:hypothetical protein n=1 Tax=Streptomyces sp. NPDC046862 TaxID=3154603 RepID=UPI003456D1E6